MLKVERTVAFYLQLVCNEILLVIITKNNQISAPFHWGENLRPFAYEAVAQSIPQVLAPTGKEQKFGYFSLFLNIRIIKWMRLGGVGVGFCVTAF